MSSSSFVEWRAIAFGAAFLLGFHAASSEDVKGPLRLVDCTRDGISTCYTWYDVAFPWVALQQNDEGQVNEDSSRKACSALNETSSCYIGFNRCPESVRRNFTRREEGYQALRALVCDAEAWNGSITSRNCADAAQMRECVSEQHGDFRGLDYEELFCTWIAAVRVCYARSLAPTCPLPLEAAKAFGKRTLDSAEMMHDCKRLIPCLAAIIILLRSYYPLKQIKEKWSNQ